ncbi:MAG: geranylgeranylglycerol-phosphate geranylgeranyltransferase [Candidatus Krumholzibacteria bacterium]|nr:geranylgeranylglycerol-phosphate geranylgeranyltransferase [Candidatus Krumholzibacteria bacterium]
MVTRLLATIEIARPHNMIAAAGCVFSGYILVGGNGSALIMASLVFTALVTGLGNLVNDYYDRDIDRINKPRRPIPSGRLTPGYVLRVYWYGSIATMLLMPWFVPARMLILIFAWQVLLYYYARRVKRIAVAGNVLIASIAASAFWGGATLSGDYHAAVFPMLLAFLLVMGRELVKSAEDVGGDREAGAATLAVRFGAVTSVHVGALSLCLCAMVAPLPGLLEYYGRTYALLMTLIFVPGVLAACYLALRSPQRVTLHRTSWILKIQMFFGIVAMSLGRL